MILLKIILLFSKLNVHFDDCLETLTCVGACDVGGRKGEAQALQTFPPLSLANLIKSVLCASYQPAPEIKFRCRRHRNI